jgi:Protein of unknown function DUF262/Protein of unknown function (DUF1524)
LRQQLGISAIDSSFFDASTMKTNEISFEHKGIGSVLAQNRLVVPLNQREYSWEEDHVKELFQDFSSALAVKQGAYFLGTLVFTKGANDHPEVSDGQQRLATTSILLAAVRDFFQAQKDDKRAQHVADKYLSTTDLKTTETVPRLRLNVDDHEFFRKAVVSDLSSPDRNAKPTKQSHRRLARAAAIAKEYIADFLKPHKDTTHAERLVELVEFIEDHAQVIALKVPDHINAFVMFETLNDRGLKASQADLLKNHLLSFCGDRIAEGQQKWATMIGTVESLEHEDITVTYLHHVLINKYGPIREREVFDKIKSTINSQLAAISFLDELAEGAVHYAALFNPDHKQWNEYDALTRKNITTINRDLRVSQIRPLMFAVARKFSVPEAQRAFRYFVFWSVRFLIVGGRGGLLDRNYSVAANQVATGAITSAAALQQKLSEILPSDAVFAAAFAEARVSHNYLARYLLRALEQKQQNSKEPEFVPSDDGNSINLEHVLPENSGPNWPGLDADTAEACFRKIGNLVLLQASKNTLIGNSAFDKKQPVLKASAFKLTACVANRLSWGPKEISERQKELAQLAVKTWPLSV